MTVPVRHTEGETVFGMASYPICRDGKGVGFGLDIDRFFDEVFVEAFLVVEVGRRITSYNVCYTKLLRIPRATSNYVNCPRMLNP